MSRKRLSNLALLNEIGAKGPAKKIYFHEGKYNFINRLTISEFAQNTPLNASEIIAFFFKNKGSAYHINQLLEKEEILEVCKVFRLKCQEAKQEEKSIFETLLLLEEEKNLVVRPPVVTIMGHVDHGKTTLLDFIMKSKIAKSEFGGITQKTAAYQIETPLGKITFLDTPGHEAFSAMRARGAKITDIVVLVVAADEGLKPQTQEAFDHIRAAKVPVIVFINKIDRPNANVEKITQELINIGLIPDQYNGDTPFVEGSALTGEGVDSLLEVISLQSQILELKANPNRLAAGNVLECSFDRGKGALLTLLVRSGTLRKRDFLVLSKKYGRIRSLTTTHKVDVAEIGPSTPCLVSGFQECPLPGEVFLGVESEKEAKNSIENSSIFEVKETNFSSTKTSQKLLNLIIRTDNQGSAEALRATLEKLENTEVKTNILRIATGELTQADVLLAKASESQIFVFNSKINNEARQLAKESNIEIREARVIYEIVESVKLLLKGLKTPVYKSVFCGEAVILKLFFYSKVGNIAGCSMVEGHVNNNSKVEVFRKNKLVYEGVLDSLKREKRDVKKVEKGFEFGAHIHNFDKIQEGDILKFYEDVLVEEEQD